MTTNQPLTPAEQIIVEEMFKNGIEEGCRIWEDPAHPLTKAMLALQPPGSKEKATAIIEDRRRREESKG